MLLDLLGAKQPIIRSSKDHKTDFLFENLMEIGKKKFELLINFFRRQFTSTGTIKTNSKNILFRKDLWYRR